MSSDAYDVEPQPRGRTTRLGPTAYGLIGALVGLLLGFALAWSLGGNPFSDANEVDYVELTVASVSEDGDRLCWAEDPERRDSPLQCAVLALDPTRDVPDEGARITAGIVELDVPDDGEVRQIVFVGPPAPSEVDPTDGDS